MSFALFRMPRWRLVPPVALLLLALGLLLLGRPSPATAALPESDTSCTGSLSPDPSGRSLQQPDLLDYDFSCSTPISAYTIVVSRVRGDGDTVDDYSPSVTVTSNGSPSSTESVNCGGATPSNGINCYSLNGAVAGPLNAGDAVSGAIDLTDQYCGYLPKRARAGTPAVPRAIVQLIVTDSGGAQDGPFELRPTRSCPKVPAVVPTKRRPATKHRQATKRAVARR